jgi:L-alanine-DL-glutamate epimerase-like enolase superfamily enzyme
MPSVDEMLQFVPASDNLTIVGVELILLDTKPFVHVTTSDGLVGLGQASYGEDTNESLAIATFFQEEIAPQVIGLPAAYPPYVRERLLWNNYKTTGALLFRSASGIDTAL